MTGLRPREWRELLEEPSPSHRGRDGVGLETAAGGGGLVTPPPVGSALPAIRLSAVAGNATIDSIRGFKTIVFPILPIEKMGAIAGTLRRSEGCGHKKKPRGSSPGVSDST